MTALIRTILAALIAVSLAVPPAVGETAMPAAPVGVTTIDQADMPCCPCCDKQDNFKSPGCILKCATLTAVAVPVARAAQLFLGDGVLLPLVHDILHGVARTPPTHPPPA